MERVELSVHFQCKEDDGSYLFPFPRGERIQVPENDVERSFPLRYMLESVANCGDTTIPFPSSVELSTSTPGLLRSSLTPQSSRQTLSV